MANAEKIKTACPHCNRTMKVSTKYVGKVAKCPVEDCGQKFKVQPLPAPTSQAAKSEPAASPSTEAHAATDNPFLATELDASPPPPPTGLTVSEGTYATNPGRLSVNYLRWLRHKPKWPLIWITLLLLSVAVVTWSPGFLTGLFFMLVAACNFFYWRRVGDHFRYGNTNPGIVVGLEPTLIAVLTDLSMGEGEYPVIKIVEVNIKRSAGEPLKLGAYLPTVALYDHPASDDSAHWSDFFPLPADYATGDIAKVLFLLATFERSDFDELKAGLKHIAQPYQPGLFVLWPEEGKQLGRLADFKPEANS